jgi:hypothetical protein
MWTLIVFVHAGLLSEADSMAITSVANLTSEVACQTAGKKSESLVSRTKKDIRWVCVKQ